MKETERKKSQITLGYNSHRRKSKLFPLACEMLQIWSHDLSDGISYYCPLLSLHSATSFLFPLPEELFSQVFLRPPPSCLSGLCSDVIFSVRPPLTTLNTQHILPLNISYYYPALFFPIAPVTTRYIYLPFFLSLLSRIRFLKAGIPRS